MIPGLQTALSDTVAFKYKPTTLSGTQQKKSWWPVLSLEQNNWLCWTSREMLYLYLELHGNRGFSRVILFIHNFLVLRFAFGI